jgi:hypothetical protein
LARKNRKPPAAPPTATPPPIHIDFDRVDLTRLRAAASALLVAAENYHRWALAHEFRVCLATTNPLQEFVHAAAQAERELADIGMTTDQPGVLHTLVCRERDAWSAAHSLREYLLHLRRGSEEGWGGQSWPLANLIDAATMTTANIHPERLRLIEAQLRGSQPAGQESEDQPPPDGPAGKKDFRLFRILVENLTPSEIGIVKCIFDAGQDRPDRYGPATLDDLVKALESRERYRVGATDGRRGRGHKRGRAKGLSDEQRRREMEEAKKSRVERHMHGSGKLDDKLFDLRLTITRESDGDGPRRYWIQRPQG